MTSTTGRFRGLRRWRKPMQRRWYIVLLCLVVGVGVAFLVSSRTPALYQAEAVVLAPAVAPGGLPPGSPDAAAKSATNYATLIPLDDAVIAAAAAKAGVAPKDLRDSLTVTSDPGTALVRIDVVAKKALVAVDSAAAVATTVTRPDPPGQIVKDGLKLVTVPDAAVRVGESSSSALFIGGLLGLLVGLLAAFALERSDRRVDTADDLADLLGTPATDWGTVTPAEARALAYRWRSLSGVEAPEVAVVATAPMSRDDVKDLLASLGPDPAASARGAAPGTPSAARAGARADDAGTSGDIGLVAVGAPGTGEGAELRTQTSDLVVVVVREGTRMAVVRESLVRLAEYGVVVVWGLLAPKHRAHAPATAPVPATVSIANRLEGKA
jgi:hypothetical protein